VRSADEERETLPVASDEKGPVCTARRMREEAQSRSRRSLPPKWDLADPLPPGVTVGDLGQLLEAAEEVEGEEAPCETTEAGSGRRGRALKVRVEGQLVFNNIALRVNAALAGLGLAYLYEDQVQEHVAEGRLVRVLGDWCPPFSGYHLYYPSRRQAAPAFALLVEALRYRGSSR
jgi:hypothetical protein